MTVTVRQMTLAEGDLIIDYFHGASREHLEMLGVDPTRLPSRDAWRRRVEEELGLPLERRGMLLVVWRQDDQPVGFSTADRTCMEIARICTYISSTPHVGASVSAPSACANPWTCISTPCP